MRLEKTLDRRQYNFWVVFHPSPDLAGIWVAHCLDVDVVTQGAGIMHAYSMVMEAVYMVLVDDLNRGADPLRRRAPQKYWEEKDHITLFGEMGTIDAETLCAHDRDYRVASLLPFPMKLCESFLDRGDDAPALPTFPHPVIVATTQMDSTSGGFRALSTEQD